MILETEITLMILATAIVEKLECERPLLLGELRSLEHLGPLVCPQMILDNIGIILSVNNSTLVNHDLRLVPLTESIGVLRLRRNHVVEGCRLAVAVNPEKSIRMIRIVKHLILRR